MTTLFLLFLLMLTMFAIIVVVTGVYIAVKLFLYNVKRIFNGAKKVRFSVADEAHLNFYYKKAREQLLINGSLIIIICLTLILFFPYIGTDGKADVGLVINTNSIQKFLQLYKILY